MHQYGARSSCSRQRLDRSITAAAARPPALSARSGSTWPSTQGEPRQTARSG
jgi:hypothetical protein